MQRRRNQGFALALTLFLVVILATVCFGALSVATLDTRTAYEDYKASRAFYAARAGIAYAKTVLVGNISGTSEINVSKTYIPLANGENSTDEAFALKITPSPNNADNYYRIWKVESTGYYGDASHRVVGYIERETFSSYNYFTNAETSTPNNSNGYIYFASGDVIDGGKTHTNGFFSCNGKPEFGGSMTSANYNDPRYNRNSNTYTRSDGRSTRDNTDFYYSRSNDYSYDMPVSLREDKAEVFHGGQNKVELPTSTSEDIKQAANAAGTHFQSTSSTYHTVVFKQNGTAEIYTGQSSKGTMSKNPVKTITTNGANGAVLYFDGNVEVKGCTRAGGSVTGGLKGHVTMASKGSTYVVDHVIYCDEQNDVLGILSEQNIQVRTNSNGDFQIDATMMALNGSFGVENYNTGSPRGKLHIYGGITQNLRGAVGTSTVKTTRDPWTGRTTTEVVPATGYKKDYSYDPKLSTNPPPYWPTTGKLVLRYFIDRGAVGGV